MTKKDYEAIAKVIEDQTAVAAELRELGEFTMGVAKHQTACDIARDLAAIFEADNPRFDRAVFLTACGDGMGAEMARILKETK